MKYSIILLGLLFMASPLQAQEKTTVSHLTVFDITTNQQTVIKTFPYLIEAPNWTPDGRWLVYNSGGKLYKISPDG
ncbi:MAG: transporter, partial [Bacteroidales bacterium]|nr:transporter [Bacteroidales bacterium]